MKSRFRKFSNSEIPNINILNETNDGDSTESRSSEDSSEADSGSDEDFSDLVKYVMKTVIKSNTTYIPEDFNARIDIAADLIVKFTNEINSVRVKYIYTYSRLHLNRPVGVRAGMREP